MANELEKIRVELQDPELMSLADKIVQVIEEGKQALAVSINEIIKTTYWKIGQYIVEYEQHGKDRAKYDEKLINRLAKEIGRRGFEARSLHMYRRIYLVYPQLGSVIEPFLQKNNFLLSDSGISSIMQSVTEKKQNAENQADEIWRSAPAKLED